MSLGRSLILLAALTACIPSVGPSRRPIDPVEPTAAAWMLSVPEIISAADGVTVATITKIQDDWTYDHHCGIVAQILHRCDPTSTERLQLDNGMTLWTWTTGDFGLHEGERAVFIWQYVEAYPFFTCEERGAMTSQACLADRLPAMTDNLDVLPVADSARVDSLWRAAHRR